jgi:hypothetical protein
LHPGLGITVAEGSVVPVFTSLEASFDVESRSEVSLDSGASLPVDTELSGKVSLGETEDGDTMVGDTFVDVTAALVAGFRVPGETVLDEPGPAIVAEVVVNPTLEVATGVSDGVVSPSLQLVANKSNPKRGATETSEEQ